MGKNDAARHGSQAIKSNPKYHELVSKRSKFAWTLSVVMLVIYYGFILIIAFDKQFMATPLWSGSVTTVGIPIGIGVIISGLYPDRYLYPAG
jgi:uncharacterized membrane protein (DUF485 family)